MCFDAKDGKVLWEHKFNVFLTDIVSDRLGWTNLAGDPETGNIYAHGTQGLFFCFDKDGKVLWQHSLTEEYGRVSGYGGRRHHAHRGWRPGHHRHAQRQLGRPGQGRQPLRRLRQAHRRGGLVGQRRLSAPRTPIIPCPVVAVINGERLLITGGGDGASTPSRSAPARRSGATSSARGASTARRWWTATASTSATARRTRATARRAGSSAWTPRRSRTASRSWSGSVDGIKVQYASPVLHDGRLYVCDDIGKLYCLDAKAGKQLWKYQYGRNTRLAGAGPTARSTSPRSTAKFHILKPGAKGCKRAARSSSSAARAASRRRDQRQPGGRQRPRLLHDQRRAVLHRQEGPHRQARPDPRPPPTEMPWPTAAGRPTSRSCPPTWCCTPGDSVSSRPTPSTRTASCSATAKVDWELAGMRAARRAAAPPPKEQRRRRAADSAGRAIGDKTARRTKLTVDARCRRAVRPGAWPRWAS